METLSRAKIKLFSSLHQKKYRERHRLFLLEGIKLYNEALESAWEIVGIVIPEGTEPPLNPDEISLPLYITPVSVFKRLSSQVSPEGILTIVRMSSTSMRSIQDSQLPEGPGVLIAGLQDPGNLGTIMRTIAWLGFNSIVLGPDTVDVWNEKTLRASMGAIFHLDILKVEDWPSFLSQQTTRIWIGDMEGIPLNEAVMGAEDWILVGNEANGVPQEIKEIERLNRLSISRQGKGESLNVAIATSIMAWKLRNS